MQMLQSPVWAATSDCSAASFAYVQPPPQPPPPPQEPEPVEAAFLSPFSMPGESWGARLLGHTAGASEGPSPGLQNRELDPGGRGSQV